MSNVSPLETEIDFFMKKLPLWLREQEGKWVAIKGDNSIGFYEDFFDAYGEGFRKYGHVPFLVREVSKEYQEHGKFGKPRDMGFPSVGNGHGIDSILQ